MKNIAIFHPSTELYGADRIMVNAANAMREDNITIYLPKEGPLIDFIHKNLPNADVKIVDFMPVIQRSMFSLTGIKTALKYYRKFKSYFKSEHKNKNFDLVYVNTLACSLCLPLLNRNKYKVIVHVHEILEHPKIVAKITAKLASKYADRVVCVSDAVRQNLLNYTKDADKIIVLRNGIDPIDREIQLPNMQVEFFLFGRIKPEKGQWYLIEALKKINPNTLELAHFNLVGGTAAGRDDLLFDLKAKIKSYELEEFISLIGFTENITPLISSADVCLIPSQMKDPFPTTVLEAMSIGKTIITTDTGGAKEAVINGESGLIIPPDDPQKFADAIEFCIQNRYEAKDLGYNARDRFEENFTLEHFNLKWRKLIATLFSQNGKN